MPGRPKSGYQLKDGTKVPGTTTIIGRWKESGGLLQWAFKQGQEGASSLYEKRDEAADVGTHVHAMLDALLIGKKQPLFPEAWTPGMEDQARNAFGSALRWIEDTGLKLASLEEPLVSEKYRYGGTPDGHITSKRGGAVGDWKTSKAIYMDYWIQMAAYIQLIEENRPELDISDGVHIVRFGKLGEFNHTHIPRNHPGLVLAFDQFISFIDCYNRDKELKKLIG